MVMDASLKNMKVQETPEPLPEVETRRQRAAISQGTESRRKQHSDFPAQEDHPQHGRVRGLDRVPPRREGRRL
jgi:hypothetical protein